MQYPEDSQILEMILSGQPNEMGFRHLVKKYQEKLYWHIRRLVGSHDDADDVLQNTFVKVFKNINSFQQNSSLYTWLYRIATNESINFLNHNKKHMTFELNEVSTFSGGQSDNMEPNEIVSHLQKAINSLPEKQKLVFNLRYYEEMPYQQIAVITETSEGALKASYHHAVKKIEEHLKSVV